MEAYNYDIIIDLQFIIAWKTVSSDLGPVVQRPIST